MGIPAFYRWLVEKYPLSVVDVLEGASNVVNGVSLPLNTSQPNPNGVEFDNLYLDMNGIIHPCFHPEGQPPPKSYEEVFTAVFKYIDRIFSMIRPRKLLYMAIDGVAPRAKMNQQRTRRFRAAKDMADEAAGTERLRSVFESEGENLSLLEQTTTLDSNVITPGTEFMASLSSALQYYVRLRMNMDPGWRGVKVILSDANVPGEGEHKIMSYIRLQRNLPGFDPNTRHCLYGLDADLIMLALATHELHFSILREDVSKVRAPHKNPKLWKGSRRKMGNKDANDIASMQKFQFLNVWVLRDYLAHDMKIPDPTVKVDLERLVDDFVFMCLFVGNDFLPHVPSLEISEVNLERVEHFVQALGSYESAIFKRRRQVQKEKDNFFQSFSNRKPPFGDKRKKSGRFWSSPKPMATPGSEASQISGASSINSTSDGANALVDKIKLGEEGWKERYYAEKFEAETEDDREEIRRHAVLKYIEGICWVMHYYYRGVCSWQWFYPYHYAPSASDFYGLAQLEIHFTLGEPFKPFDQLMGVLPAARNLMTDSSSPILDFYPAEFELDMNGKRFAWQGVCKLPFIKESRLLTEIGKVEHTLTDEEKRRNSLGLDVLFVHISHPLAVKIFSFCKRKKDHPKLHKTKVKRKIDPKFSGGMNGYMYISDKLVWPMEIYSPIGDMEMITKNKVISIFYKYPPFHPHIPRPPEGVIVPRKSVCKRDVLSEQLFWHEKSAVHWRALSGRPTPKSISGPSLGKLSHRVVSDYYHAKQQQIVGPTKVEDHVSTDGPACQSNSKEIDCKEMGKDNNSCVNGKIPGKEKRKRSNDCDGQRIKIKKRKS
ncbi:hypothetical protein HHK36_028561 [Tetracentron sinense]|uniref:5'-3' exoribonuclease n=1 Tax=Tetracentron sinense TaxID=13715 RepID=A0A835D0C3_TETSI|nr:hypothetical protein HHK36_028561 [Tetracentron sinense]